MNATPAPVYSVGLRAKKPGDSQPAKIETLARALGMDTFPWKHKLVAVKTHFGERGSASFPRPFLLRPADPAAHPARRFY